jgi:hypothetical protein
MRRYGKRTVVLAAVGFAVLGCSRGETVTARSLAAARRVWKSANLRDYDLEWTSRGARDGHYRVFVRGGLVRSVRAVDRDGSEHELKPADPSYFSVDGLFLVIQDEMDQQFAERPFGMPKGSNLLLKFQVDPALGYPREYRRDVSGGLKSLAIDVVRLNPEPPGEIPPLATGSP